MIHSTPPPQHAYTPVPCSVYVKRLHIDGKPVTNEALASILAAANRQHHVVNDNGVDQTAAAQAILDYAGCLGINSSKKAWK